MTRLQNMVKVFDSYVKVSTVPEVYETMVFNCTEEGEIINIDNPIYQCNYETMEAGETNHKNIIALYEGINKNGYTRNDWKGSFYDTMQVNQFVHEEVVDELMNCLPPKKYNSYICQFGEAYSYNKYATFKKMFGFWYYAGLEA